MEDKLYMLKVACYTLSDLKERERVYNRALVVEASKGLMKIAGVAPREKRAWIGKALGLLGAGGAIGAIASGYGRDMYNATMRGLNHVNSNWGTNEVMEYANRGNMTPQERDRYLTMRLGASRNYNKLRSQADARLQANRNAAYQNYRNMDAVSQGDRMINSGRVGAGMAYGAGRAGSSGYGYGGGFGGYGASSGYGYGGGYR